MKLTMNITAATFATLLIGGLAMSPASAAVKHENIRYDFNEDLLDKEVKKLKLEGSFELNDLSYAIGAISPKDSSQALK